MLTRLLGQMVVMIVCVNMLLLVGGGGSMAAGGDAAKAAGPAAPIRIVAFGDSLTAGYGVAPGQAFPDQLGRALAAAGHNVAITNAGVSGDTTAGGLVRLDWAVPESTQAVIVELGANDMLAGLSPARARANLEAIVKALRGRKIEVLIAGMVASRSLGNDYARAFDPIFSDLARTYDCVLYPFFLEGVALDPKLNQPDDIHPTAEGVAVIVERMLPKVEELIGRVRRQGGAGAGSAGR